MKTATCDKHEGCVVTHEALECPVCQLVKHNEEIEELKKALEDANDDRDELEDELYNLRKRVGEEL